MSNFRRYLEGKGLAPSTVAGYARSASELLDGLRAEGVSAEEATYRDLLAWLRTLEVSPKTRNGKLTAARHYMAHLVEEGRRTDNPARGLVVRGERRRLPHDLLTTEQLDELYQSYPVGSPARHRNKAMLGLLVYQGLHVHELARLDTEDVDLEGGLITIPSSRIAEGRTLYLEGRQVLALHVYLAEARPVLLASTEKQTDRLFTSAGSGARLNNAVAVLLRELRRRHGFFRDAKQLRASRLALWMKTEHLREVQHMAGHRWVSSTERYQAQDLDRLQASLAKHHPLS